MKAGYIRWATEVGFFCCPHQLSSDINKALGCADCHGKNGRLDKLTGFYLPGRDKSDLIGWLAVLGTLGGLTLHGFGRVVFRNRRNQ